MLAKIQYSSFTNLRLALNHGINQFELTLCNLDNLFDQTTFNLVLNVLNSAQLSALVCPNIVLHILLPGQQWLRI
jgi:hypothetical protein